MTIAKRTEDQIWYRGYGDDQYVYYARKGPREYLGGTFVVETYQDLEKYVALTFYQVTKLTKYLIGLQSFQQPAKSKSYLRPLGAALW